MHLLNHLKSLVYQKSPRFIFQYLTHSGDAIAHLSTYGFSMILNLDDYAISRPILIKGKYEQHVTKVLLEYLTPNIHFLDIGANLGYYSLLVANQCPEAKIYSFEPDVKNFHLFKSSIIYNKFEEIIQAYPLAIGDENQTIIISNLGNQGNSGARFTAKTKQDLIPHIHGENPEFQEISAVSLDTFLPNITVDVLKIDIEGYEPFAIRGMMQLLKKNRPIIFAEFAPHNLKILGKTEPKDFLQLFTALDYTINVIDRQGNVISYHQNIDDLINYFETLQTHHIDILLLPLLGNREQGTGNREQGIGNRE